jgi:site-specific recombinase XerD
MAQSVPDSMGGLRDRALLLLGFAGAFRRSELVALDVADLEETRDGLGAPIARQRRALTRWWPTLHSRANLTGRSASC